VVVPRDEFSGSRIINIVNNLLKLPGHKLTAAWNSVLPKTAEIVLRYRSAAGRSAEVIVNDPKKGIAGMNDWQLTGKEIDLVSHWPDGKDSSVTFARVRVSARICGLIQAQRGTVWIAGGTASATWRDKALVPELDVVFTHQ